MTLEWQLCLRGLLTKIHLTLRFSSRITPLHFFLAMLIYYILFSQCSYSCVEDVD